MRTPKCRAFFAATSRGFAAGQCGKALPFRPSRILLRLCLSRAAAEAWLVPRIDAIPGMKVTLIQ
jgi:hypothetical protein